MLRFFYRWTQFTVGLTLPLVSLYFTVGLVPVARDAALRGGADGGGDGPRGVGSPRQLLRPDFVPRPAGRGADRLLSFAVPCPL